MKALAALAASAVFVVGIGHGDKASGFQVEQPAERRSPDNTYLVPVLDVSKKVDRFLVFQLTAVDHYGALKSVYDFAFQVNKLRSGFSSDEVERAAEISFVVERWNRWQSFLYLRDGGVAFKYACFPATGVCDDILNLPSLGHWLIEKPSALIERHATNDDVRRVIGGELVSRQSVSFDRLLGSHLRGVGALLGGIGCGRGVVDSPPHESQLPNEQERLPSRDDGEDDGSNGGRHLRPMWAAALIMGLGALVGYLGGGGATWMALTGRRYVAVAVALAALGLGLFLMLGPMEGWIPGWR